MLSPITRRIVTDKNMKYQTGNTASKNEATTYFVLDNRIGLIMGFSCFPWFS